MMYLASYKGPADDSLHRLTHWLICHLGPKSWLPYVPADYSHNELVLDYREGAASECASSSFRDGGVRIKWIDLGTGRWDLQPLPQYDGTDAVFARLWFQAHAGDKYDTAGVLAFIKALAPVVAQSLRRWFCSESVAAALGLQDSHTFTPQSLRDHLTSEAGQPVSA